MRTVFMLRYLKDQNIRENIRKVQTAKKWEAEVAINSAVSKLRRADIVREMQEATTRIGLHNLKPYFISCVKDMNDPAEHKGRKKEW